MAVSFTTPLDQVEVLYLGYFGRAGDPAGVNYWIVQLTSGAMTFAQAAASFSVQPEATTKYPYLATPNVADPSVFVDQVFLNLFNHVADAAGRAYWVAQLNARAGNAQAVGGFILDVASGAQGTDATAVQNKLAVAGYFTTALAGGGTTYNAAADVLAHTEVTATTADPATVAAQKAMTDAFIATAPGPQVAFTLGLDTLTSGANRADFNAPLLFNAPSGTLAASLQTGDSVTYTGANGTLTAQFNAGPVAGFSMSGAATANLTNLGGPTAGFSGTVSGLTAFNNNNSLGGLALGVAGNGLKTALATVNINNAVASNTTALIAASALAGAADAVALNLSGAYGTATAATFVSLGADGAVGTAGTPQNGYETVAVTANAPTFLQLGDVGGVQSLKTVTVAGAGTVELSGSATADFQNITAIDASASSGGMTITGASSPGAGTAGLLDGNVRLTSFKGGSGADSLDVFSFTTAAQLAGLTADGGAARDTLIVASFLVAGASAATVPSNLGGVGNVEILSVTDAAGFYDFAKVPASVDTLKFASFQVSDVVINNAPTSFTLDTQNFGNGSSPVIVNFAGSGTADTFTLILGNAVGNSGIGSPVRVTGAETVNIVANGPDAGPGVDFLVGGFPDVVTLTASPGGSERVVITGNAGLFSPTMNLIGAGSSIVASNAGSLSLVGISGGALIDNSTNAGLLDATATGGLNMLRASGNDGTLGVQIRGSAASPNVFGGSFGNDILLGGADVDVIATYGGADTINLGSVANPDLVALYIASDLGLIGFDFTGLAASITAATAADTARGGFWGLAPGAAAVHAGGLAANTGTSASMSVITNFLAGSSAAADILQISVGAWGAAATNVGLTNADLATTVTAGAPASIAQVMAGGTAAGDANVIALVGQSFASATAVAAALKSGAFGFNFAAAGTAGNFSHQIIAWQDTGGNTRLSDLDVDQAASAATTAQTLYVSDMVQLVGVSLASLAGNNINFVS